MKIVLASSNQGKLQELQLMLADLGCQLTPQSTFNIEGTPEPFCTFIENALTKARYASRLSQLPAIADDAGLCVDSFGGLPGVDTAYYATQFGLPANDENNVQCILQQMHRETNRQASMVCTLVALQSWQDPDPLIAQGRIDGQLTQIPCGDTGFGFDPIFFVPELKKTLAQLSTNEKNTISHRGKAAASLRALIQARWT